MITASILKAIFPTAREPIVQAIVTNWSYAESKGIAENRSRTALFFAMIGVESRGLRSLVESLNYTSAARIKSTWPTRFKTLAQAEPFVRQPAKLANKVYNGRMGNRSGSNDGFTYRGRGLMQTTGRDGYEKLMASTGYDLVSNPDLLADPKLAFISACIEWERRGCNAMADAEDIDRCRRAINGGLIGIKEVREYYAKATRVLKAAGFGGSAVPVEPRMVPTTTPADQLPTSGGTAYSLIFVQQQLSNLGYTEVGKPDDKMGPLTRAAILAFREDNGLPLTPEIDQEFLTTLAMGRKRVLDEGRVNATVKEVTQKVPEMKAVNKIGMIAKIGGAITALVTIVEGVMDQVDPAMSILQPLTAIFNDAPNWLWGVGGVALAGAIYWQTTKAQKAGVSAFQTGARR